MRFAIIIKIFGVLLMIYSLSMLPPAMVDWYFHEHVMFAFLSAFAAIFLVGLVIYWPLRHIDEEIKTRDGFLLVAMFWLIFSFLGAIPFLLALYPSHITVTDAFFESVSGLTATGTNVVAGLDHLPNALRYYRQQLDFLGGMGVVLLAVAILPMLGIGGFQLYQAETVGPVKDNKLRPRIAQTAKALWGIYAGLTAICAFAFWCAGMTAFEAVSESFGAVSTGGFSIYDASFAHYNSYAINWIAIFFMLLGGTNFSLHYQFLRTRRLRVYFADTEFRAFLTLLAIYIVVVAAGLLAYNFHHPIRTIMSAIFNTVSMATTTGVITTNINHWPSYIPYFIMFAALIGGCSASTSGGFKVMRFVVMRAQIRRELKKLIHPKAVIPLRAGKEILPDQVVNSTWAFMGVFLFVFAIILVVLMATGMDFRTAFGALAACYSNAGAAIGDVTQNFSNIAHIDKWILIFAMLAGRLEIFTLLVLFTPDYWRR